MADFWFNLNPGKVSALHFFPVTVLDPVRPYPVISVNTGEFTTLISRWICESLWFYLERFHYSVLDSSNMTWIHGEFAHFQLDIIKEDLRFAFGFDVSEL